MANDQTQQRNKMREFQRNFFDGSKCLNVKSHFIDCERLLLTMFHNKSYKDGNNENNN